MIVPSFLFSMTLTTPSGSVRVEVRVEEIVGVPVAAMSSAGILGAQALASLIIHAQADWFKMSRVHTLLHAAKMVKREPILDRPNEKFVGKAVWVDQSSPVKEAPVSSGVMGCRPQPTSRGLVHLRPKPLFGRSSSHLGVIVT